MADYYPLLSKAVAGLDPNTAQARQDIFERARLALTRQMASMDPPVPQAIVDREIGGLTDAMQRIEAELLIAPPATPATASVAPSPAPRAPTVNEPAPPVLTAPPQARPQVKLRESETKRNPLLTVAAALGFVVVAAIATLAYLRRNEPAAIASRPTEPVAAPAPAAGGAKPEVRVAPSAPETPARAPQAQPQPVPQTPSTPPPISNTPPPQPAPPPQIAIANRMVMIMEGKEDPQKVDSRQGSVIWRTEMVSGGQAQTPQLAIRATIDVPEARQRAEITIQRNRDPAFPASHTVQVQFSGIGTSEFGVINNLNQIEFRQNENQTGYALAGQGITVMENVFLVALASIEPAQSRNIEMMKTRPLIYLEFQAAGGRRGAMLLEKGVSGQQAFDDAFRNWQ